jgi:hypothetical protein
VAAFGSRTWQRYRLVEGPLQSALLSLYILVAVLPALLAVEEYLDPHPNSLANSLVRHFRLNTETSQLMPRAPGKGHSQAWIRPARTPRCLRSGSASAT